MWEHFCITLASCVRNREVSYRVPLGLPIDYLSWLAKVKVDATNQLVAIPRQKRNWNYFLLSLFFFFATWIQIPFKPWCKTSTKTAQIYINAHTILRRPTTNMLLLWPIGWILAMFNVTLCNYVITPVTFTTTWWWQKS